MANRAPAGAGVLPAGFSAGDLVRRAASIPPRGSDLEAVEHVVVVMQENRSFDHYFGTYRGARGFGDLSGPTAHTGHLVPYRVDSSTIHAHSAGNPEIPRHDWVSQHLSWNRGGMDGFARALTSSDGDGSNAAPPIMGYLSRDDLPFYYALADTFTLCDAYHCSVLGPTMPNRLYALSATNDPTGANGGPVLHTPGASDSPRALGSCSWPTMPEQLSAHGISWKVYQPPGSSVGPWQPTALATGFNALLYFRQYLQPDSVLYNRAFLPAWPDEFVADVRLGTLPTVSWMLPPIASSEHPSAPPGLGEPYVGQILAALSSNPEVWAKTVMFVTYDENGGFFDHVNPVTPPPDTVGEFVTASLSPVAGGIAGPIGLGFRVPTLVLSPFSRGGRVSSDLFDHTSLLRFLETRFQVPVPNLSTWRRDTVGDLTSTLDFGVSDTLVGRSNPAGAGLSR